MKTTIYIRIAKNRKEQTSVAASKRPCFEPLRALKGFNKYRAIPTIFFAINVDIPDAEFEKAGQLLELKINSFKQCVDVKEGECEVNHTIGVASKPDTGA